MVEVVVVGLETSWDFVVLLRVMVTVLLLLLHLVLQLVLVQVALYRNRRDYLKYCYNRVEGEVVAVLHLVLLQAALRQSRQNCLKYYYNQVELEAEEEEEVQVLEEYQSEKNLLKVGL